ncbi:MAG TPA: PSD1 and planctomycete cytochrome C domain-containing protein [Pirellulales bacterium]|nr:PSD1 and planctomycete cytochrome C domain-containing protein [Pirellulales bacterium]
MACALAAGVDADEPSRAPQFERDVWPIVVANCLVCHGVDKPKGQLDLRTVTAILRGGESGPAVERADPDASALLQRISNGEMPPGDRRKLTSDEIALVRDWVLAGAPAQQPDAVPPLPPPVSERDRQFWAFQTLARPKPPSVADGARVRNPIDAFVLARLEARGLTFSPAAEAVTLVRRVYLDLLGLLPSPAEVDAFLADAAPDAYERLIDRLLASPHFGERWGRHWLDVAGYVDTVGFDVDGPLIITSDGKWLYRDYVIAAFNADKPFDRFVTEQLAGDELYDWRRAEHFTPEIREALIATGYLRTARDLTHEDVGVIPQNFHGILHDTVEIVGTGMLGLTIHCARCHSHKFDPIPQEDYYRLVAAFTPAYNPRTWRPVVPINGLAADRSLADIAPVEQAENERHNREIDARVETIKRSLADVRRPYEAQLSDSKLASLPEPIRDDVKQALAASTEKRTEIQKYLFGKFSSTLAVKPEEIAAALNETDKRSVAECEAQIAEANAARRTCGKLQALFDLGPPPPTHLLVRGDFESPGAEVPPGFLRVLCRSEADAVATVAPPHEGTSGRRTALARWLTATDSPAAGLLARVHVNRIWRQLFGRGLVSTPDNFGVQGQRPTHPELLDWLAAEFMAGGWRVKPLMKSMLLSSVYRQASRRESTESTTNPQPALNPEMVDPANDLLWKMRLRRLESEVVRDTILAAGGQLNRAVGGPPVPIETRMDGMVVVARNKLASPADACRRSVYLLTRRAYNLSLLAVFDQPPVATNCLARDASAVPPQSLTMLNDEFIAEQARGLADRVETAVTVPPEEIETARIEMAFRLALVRKPDSRERDRCREIFARQAQRYRTMGESEPAAMHLALVQLCRTLFNTSEFLYAE